MRIRKRKVPLPFSSISPVPLPSDPNSNRSPVVQLPLQLQQPQPPIPCFDLRPSSDHPNNHPIGQLPTQSRRDSPPFSASEQDYNKKQKKKEDYLQGDEEEKGEEEERSNDTRKKSVLGADLGTGSSSSHQVVGRWGEGEKAFPLKKRRGIGYDDEAWIMEEDDSSNNKKAMNHNKKKMKTKMNKKFDDIHEAEEKESKDSVNNGGGAKRRGRGGALMEGSRCSRVNGRGWRCCQQTLVGYSLCEHHLGKGRLRSMNSVRNRSLAAKKEDEQQQKQPDVKDDHPLSNTYPSQQTKQNKFESLHGNQSGENGNEQQDDSKPLMMTKKRVKLGMVKARSISSLLGQNDNSFS